MMLRFIFLAWPVALVLSASSALVRLRSISSKDMSHGLSAVAGIWQTDTEEKGFQLRKMRHVRKPSLL